MVKWKLYYIGTDETVEVFLDAKGPNDMNLIQYKGSKEAVELIQLDLESSSGIYGHLIDGYTTPVDVQAAMLSSDMSIYGPELVEGGKILNSYENDIPEDAFT